MTTQESVLEELGPEVLREDAVLGVSGDSPSSGADKVETVGERGDCKVQSDVVKVLVAMDAQAVVGAIQEKPAESFDLVMLSFGRPVYFSNCLLLFLVVCCFLFLFSHFVIFLLSY